ncbi:MAG: PIN domain-containing protein [Deinococcota bacterium]|nr:PIN domain-containing protein [Deinococcota bacterium]
MSNLRLIDTSAWIDFFQNRQPVANVVDAALADGSAAICGMVELEVRQGLRRGEEDVLLLLQSTVRLETGEEDFARTGDTLADLRRKGITLPATDGLIAQIALKYQVPLLENDKHFGSIEGLNQVPWRAS